ncbi:WD repeat-containing protein 73 isoform X2 [Numida meleagris]|uniref:WD repeat-containing protein 73 isoform X2 n=1 Tax=Numida meleagris TaxID=8996 RepID=UPI000B3DEC8E|nr:WD repeat-containing protein 73 isoform X2 [Numida meleagris]
MEAAGERGEEEEEEVDEEEEWLLESLHLYEALHAFELQAPTRVIEWALGKRVCVAGYGRSGRNEILQLLPPATLQAKESQGLCPERDFKVECGGFSNRPVYGLKHVPDTSLLVTSGPPDSSLQVWQVAAEDSDVIKPVSTIPTENSAGETWAKIATTSTRAPWVLHGSRLSSTQITEVESQKKVYVAASGSNELLSSLAFLDANTSLLCCAAGQLCVADVRQHGPLQPAPIPSAPRGQCWCTAVGCGAPGSELSSQPIACLSSGGQLILVDARKTSQCLASAKCGVPSPGSSAEFLSVSWAPALEGCLAVSGFDGSVHIYDTRGWDGAGGDARPLFVHRGHAPGNGERPQVTAHAWHPQKARTLLSAATDGSLHVWEWVQPRGS